MRKSIATILACLVLAAPAHGRATDYLTSETPARIISDQSGFTLNTVAYPTGWLLNATQTALAAIGFYTITYTGASLDPRYYSNALGTPVIAGNGATIPWVNTPLSLATVKAQKLLDLNSYALVRDANGTVFGGFAVFTTDTFKIRYAIMNQRAIAGTQSSFTLLDAAGTFHTLTSAQMQSLYTTVAAYIAAVLTNQNTHSTAISALSTAAAVIAYDYTTGWP